MANERLSKLQKWILVQAYKEDSVSRREIYDKYFALKARGAWERVDPVTAVILSRSLKRLKERGLIISVSGERFTHKITLTPEGVEKVEQVLQREPVLLL